MKACQFRHDCQHLGCANVSCPQCALCQKRRCSGSFKKKYLAPSDVLEANCGSQIYVVVVDTSTGMLEFRLSLYHQTLDQRITLSHVFSLYRPSCAIWTGRYVPGAQSGGRAQAGAGAGAPRGTRGLPAAYKQVRAGSPDPWSVWSVHR